MILTQQMAEVYVDTHYPDGKLETRKTYVDDELMLEEAWFPDLDQDGNQIKHYQKSYDSGFKHGTWKTWYNNGKIREIVNYDTDNYHGLRADYHDDGYLDCQIYYEHGKRHGEHIEYHPHSIILLQRAHFLYDLHHGLHEEWYADGTPKLKRTYDHGDRHGESLEYYESGKLHFHDNFVRDKLHGECKMWNENSDEPEIQSYYYGVRID